MRTFVCFLSLLLYAFPVLSVKYHIRNELGNCILSNDRDRAGSRVITAHGCSSNTVLHVDASIDLLANTFGHVSGKSGLFVGRSHNRKYLEWVEKPYKWEFSPVAIRPYHTVHVPGHDELNWVDGGDDKVVKIDVGNELWHFVKVHA
ncbi:hypothetical protein APHAL10511_003214 [Amanita phalloides]|nr:hypothetical protein APHAL10511_003214 [Amanita phalloides]